MRFNIPAVEEIYSDISRRNPHEPEFLQAAGAVLRSIEPVCEKRPEYVERGVVACLVEPERVVKFRVPWVDDSGAVRVNRGFRAQFNGAIGPYKGGLRFHPSVYEGIIKFLGFEQVFKNALTGFPIGGGKGGSDFDPRGRSDGEVMRFCQSFMTELCKYVGPNVDVPAGDIGVGAREIGYMYGQYRRLTGRSEGAFTGKGLSYGGSLARTEATGFGLCYFAQAMLRDRGMSFDGRTAVVSGSGNVALHACQKATELGARVVAMSDSDGYVFDPNGIDLDALKTLKLKERKRIREYAVGRPGAEYRAGSRGIWGVPCDIALPCATQNELNGEDARLLLKNGCACVCEGANMPCSPDAVEAFLDAKIPYSPGKASNAGGVAVSALEMSQNSMRYSWTFEEVDRKLRETMESIYANVSEAAEEYGLAGNLVAGANICGFARVADAMLAQGAV